MGIDVTTLALARKYAEKIVAGEITPSDTYSKEELDKKFDNVKDEVKEEVKEEIKISDVHISQIVQEDDEEFILFGGDSSA